uniref:Zinc metalloproteinase n=1 Tax=Strongyloides stercoralis TaxID=6248 RepID=A0A0K0EJM0_STRER
MYYLLILLILLSIFTLSDFLPNTTLKKYIENEISKNKLECNNKSYYQRNKNNKREKIKLNQNLTSNNFKNKIFELKNDIKIFQGDIILRKDQEEYFFSYNNNIIESEIKKEKLFTDLLIRDKRKVVRNLNLKWEFPIPYFVANGVNEDLVEKAIYFIEKDTCIRFEKYDTPEVGISGIYYTYGSGCKSYIGKQPGNIWQDIVLGKGCSDVGRVQHETLHALGFFHEQNRFDRDRYIKILLNNVIENEKYNFLINTKQESDTMNFAYDYGSIMHYGVYSFSKNNQPTMLPIDILYKKTIGHADKATFSDIKMINQYYCSSVCSYNITCMNGGYQDPKNCDRCKCVEGYAGTNCSRIQAPEISCGKAVYKVNNSVEALQIKGIKHCIFHFIAPVGSKVGVKILSLKMLPNKKRECLALNSIEVKYWRDKSISGARFCLYTGNILFISHNNHVIIYYRSTTEANYFSIVYKAIDVSDYNLKEKEIKKRLKKLKKKN